ncbi:hypothetical protein H2198_001264 [Neophaeococcomyces mojaviensis]|uniref:Uncharacterized protein n=1 Tax=Neophaeococcomyces mojaviensis TaxID=3383035 RepID=A0ACC3AHF5_9EURO|nr:hypothetical protein H2198_001264 [Knufia sp. JES_112]
MARTMDEVRSAQSQLNAQRRALQGVFDSQRGWPDTRAPPLYAGESEKLTITRTTEPIVMLIRGKNKKLAVITSPILRDMYSLSGWTDDHPHLQIIGSASWCNNLIKFAQNTGLQLPRHKFDGNVPGRFHASHAEAKLLAIYMDFLTNHLDALQFLGQVTQWDYKVLDLDVSDAACGGCQLIARQLYERYDVLVNFTSQGQICYPKCKNFRCAAEMRDGSRVFCGICQTQMTHLQMTRIDLPRKSAAELGKIIEEAAKQLALCTGRKSFIRDIVKVAAWHPTLGLELYHQDEVRESDLTIIVEGLTPEVVEEIVEDCLEKALTLLSPPNDNCMNCARRAVFAFIHILDIPALAQAFGDVDTFPWTKALRNYLAQYLFIDLVIHITIW